MYKHLLRTQANQVLSLLQQNGFQPEEFDWQQSQYDDTDRFGSGLRHEVDVLVHRSSHYHFVFGTYSVQFSPGIDTTVDRIPTGAWDEKVMEAVRWMYYMKRELEAPDLWDVVVRERELVERILSTGNNLPFTKKEQAAISATVNEIKSYIITTQHPSPEQTAIVQANLEYLKEASKRVGRKDWTILAIGTLFNIFVSAAFAPDRTRDIFRFAANALHQVFGGFPLLPP